MDQAQDVLLVTGGAGFIGSHFINNYARSRPHARIMNLDALYYAGSEEHVDAEVRASSRYSFHKLNLRDFDALVKIVSTNAITHVVHFAAQSHVTRSFNDSREYTLDNVVGTHNLLEACRLHAPSLKKFVHVSTDEVYGESMLGRGTTSKTEQSVLCPTNPYAATKAGAELIAQSYAHSWGMPLVITRGNNVYGPNQHDEKVIPSFMSRLKRGQKVQIEGTGDCVRAFMHASDAARAFQLVLEKGRIGEIYNLGCDQGAEISIMDLAIMIVGLVKGKEVNAIDWIELKEDRPFNDKRYFISNQKIKSLGWKQTVTLEDGLSRLALS